MSVVPCQQNKDLRKLIKEYAEVLKTESHKLGAHGLNDKDFYQSGLFRGAIERVRGQFSSTMREKREFCKHVLNYIQDKGFIADWEPAGEANRHDYVVRFSNGRVAVIELKGCLDGNNTNIFDGPHMRRNLWFGASVRILEPIRGETSGPEFIRASALKSLRVSSAWTG
jgi:hypothetical protein